MFREDISHEDVIRIVRIVTDSYATSIYSSELERHRKNSYAPARKEKYMHSSALFFLCCFGVLLVLISDYTTRIV
jgi:hypothetical protein